MSGPKRQWIAFPGNVPVCRDCGHDWAPVRRGQCRSCGSDAGPLSTPTKPVRHNHDATGVYANCPACGTVLSEISTPPAGGDSDA